MTPNESITAENINGAYHSAIEQGSLNKGFFSGKSIVHVTYLSDKYICVSEFLEACQICSEGIGREERNSATKDVFVEIVKCTDTLLRQMGDNELENCPWLDGYVYSSSTKFPTIILSAKDLPQNLNLLVHGLVYPSHLNAKPRRHSRILRRRDLTNRRVAPPRPTKPNHLKT